MLQSKAPFIRAILTGAALCAVAAFWGAGGGAAAKEPTTAALQALPAPTVTGNQISPFDSLRVNIFGVPSLSGEYPVDQDGRIKMPLIGEIDAAGQSATAFAKVLQTKLTEKFLQEGVDVTVSIVGGGVAAMVTVEGTVRSPGMFPMRGKMTLLQCIALSGGPAQGADQRRVAIFRTIEGKRHAAVFNLREIRKGRAEDPALFGGDIVVVDGSSTSGAYQGILRALPLFPMFLAL